jgi:hypothetical protein
MNIVDLISSQLSGDVLSKLGGLVGAPEEQTASATKAAVPALLEVFAKLASSRGGADQLAGAMGGLDLSKLGDLAGLLVGGNASGLGEIGGKLLGSLLGGGNLSSLIGTIASFVGSQPDLMKKLLTYLAPIVLGMVAKQLGGRPDAAGVSRLFSEQAGNISSAMPQGLSLGNLASLLPSGGGTTAGSRPEPAAATPGWLLPLLLLAALGVVGYYLMSNMGQGPKDEAVVVGEKLAVDGDVVDEEKVVVATDGETMRRVVDETLTAVPGLGDTVKSLTSVFGGLTKLLEGVSDEATAEAALPELEGMLPLVDAAASATAAFPAAGKTAIAELVGEKLGPLQQLIDKVLALPGVEAVLGEKITGIVKILGALGR